MKLIEEKMTMPAAPHAVFRDPEEIALLYDEPELLAIADAYACTQERPVEERARLLRPIARRAVVLAAAAAILSVLGVFQPWHTSESFAARALSALGNGPMLHVVLAGSRPGQLVVDRATGTRRPLTTEIDEWYDVQAGTLHVVQRSEGQTVSDLIDRGNGGIINSEGGIGYTCSWIAAHPTEAARAGVSCDPSTTTNSRQAAVAPAFSAFLRGYRNALSSGEARKLGTGVVDGTSVIWIQVSSPEETDEVALDADTYLPILVRPLDDKTNQQTGMQWTVKTIETLPLDPDDFTFSAPPPSVIDDEQVLSSVNVSSTAVGSALGRPVLWLGDAVAGLSLNSVKLQTLAISNGTSSRRIHRLELSYGGTPDSFVTLDESLDSSNPGPLPITPAPGTMNVVELGILSEGDLGVVNGLRTTIRASTTDLLITAATALTTTS